MKSKKPQPKSKTSAQPQQEPLTPEEKLQQAVEDHEHWSQVAAQPGMGPTAAAWAAAQARSAWAEMQARQKGAAWGQNSPAPETDLDPNLSRLLLGPNPASAIAIPPGSENAETSA